MPTCQNDATSDSRLSSPARKLRDVIKNKLPLSEQGLKDVVKLIKVCSLNELSLLGLQPPPVPAMCQALTMLTLQDRLHEVQALISSLQYNHSPSYFYDVSKQRPLPAILSTAAGILRDPMPIKCIEAVFLGLLLTQRWEQSTLQRIPVGFKSMAADGQMYKHIVLAINDTSTSCFGGLGMSRRDNLMYKPLMFHSLYELVQDYIYAYSYWGHNVVKVRVGLPVEHDPTYAGPVCWRYCTINPQKHTRDKVAATLNTHAAAAAKLQEKFKAAASKDHTNNSISSSLVTPRPHVTKPYAAAASSVPHAHGGDRHASPRAISVNSSRQGLVVPQSTPTAASGVGHSGCKATTVNSDSHSNSHSNSHSINPAPRYSRHSSSSARQLSEPPAGVAAGEAQVNEAAAAVTDDGDSSSDEVDADVSVCTFDSDSEVNEIVKAIRAESPPCSTRPACASQRVTQRASQQAMCVGVHFHSLGNIK